MRFFIIAGIRQVSSSYDIEPADALVRSCRLIKSPAEIALMQLANDITIAALRVVRAQTSKGMTAADLGALMDKTTVGLGGAPEFALSLLNEASAFPHGSVKPQTVREGSIILMDCGCTVHGYQSDISRTWVYGEPNAKQRKVWDTVKQGPGRSPCRPPNWARRSAASTMRCAGIIKARVGARAIHLPGLSHRTGHGIGLDGHEPPYLVHGDATPLAAGMCFSDEPGIYIPGEFGVRSGGLLVHDFGGSEDLYAAGKIDRRPDLMALALLSLVHLGVSVFRAWKILGVFAAIDAGGS
jgi:Xaa-Pro dipeptidase